MVTLLTSFEFLFKKLIQNETGIDCRYWVNVGEIQKVNFVAFDGCYRLCNRTYTVSVR